MITDVDITKLKREFAPVFAGRHEFLMLKTDVADIKVTLAEHDEKFDTLLRAMDGLTRGFETFKIEGLAQGEVLMRHDRQIDELARKTGVRLSVA